MKKSTWILALVSLVLIGGLALSLTNSSPVMAAPNPQMTNFPTPTPGSDGRIIYVVKEGDTLWRIAAVSGINVADLRDLNFLDADDIVFVGMQLFLGLGGPAGEQPTPAPAATEFTAEPTVTSIPGNGTLCVLLYEDPRHAGRLSDGVPAARGRARRPHRGPPHEMDGTEPGRGKIPEFRRPGMARWIEE